MQNIVPLMLQEYTHDCHLRQRCHTYTYKKPIVKYSCQSVSQSKCRVTSLTNSNISFQLYLTIYLNNHSDISKIRVGPSQAKCQDRPQNMFSNLYIRKRGQSELPGYQTYFERSKCPTKKTCQKLCRYQSRYYKTQY